MSDDSEYQSKWWWFTLGSTNPSGKMWHLKKNSCLRAAKDSIGHC